jgi:hypothetical protein
VLRAESGWEQAVPVGPRIGWLHVGLCRPGNTTGTRFVPFLGPFLEQRYSREREGLSFSWCVILLIRVKTIFIRKKKRVKTIFLVPREIFRFLRARAADPRADLVSQRHPLIRFSGGSVLSDTAKMASAAASYRCGVAGGFVAI